MHDTVLAITRWQRLCTVYEKHFEQPMHARFTWPMRYYVADVVDVENNEINNQTTNDTTRKIKTILL